MKPKEEVTRILQQLPDNASLDEIQYQIYLRQRINRGLDAVADERTLDEADFDVKLAEWLDR